MIGTVTVWVLKWRWVEGSALRELRINQSRNCGRLIGIDERNVHGFVDAGCAISSSCGSREG
jgi:hypothetical protein